MLYSYNMYPKNPWLYKEILSLPLRAAVVSHKCPCRLEMIQIHLVH